MIYNFGLRTNFALKTSPLRQLKDLIVLELASVLAGPGVGQFFAELGAEVIKVENVKTSGDVTRSWRLEAENTDDRSAYFCSANWGKRSIAVNLGTVEGRDIVHRLAARAQVVIASYKPGDAEKLGVDYKTLSAGREDLIYGQITGYGSDNQRVGYDAIIQAEAGFVFMNGEPGGPSLKMPVALMDILAGHHLKEGLLLALLEKMQTGKGRLVEVSLIQAAIASLANQASNYLVAGKLPEKQGSAHPNIAPYGEVFLTADGKELLLAVGTDRQFRQLANTLEINVVLDMQQFETNVLRVKNRVQLNRVLGDAIARRDAAVLLKALHHEKIPCGIIRNMHEVMADPAAREMLLSAPSLRGIRSFAAHAGESFSSHILPPPHLGEHTREILEGLLKFGPSDINSLLSRDVIL